MEKRKIATEIKRKIIEVSKKENGILAVYIFGSYGTDYQRKNSDLDLAILFDENPGIMDQMELAGKYELAIGIKVDLINLNNVDIILKHEVIIKGEKIYSKDEIKIADFVEYVLKFASDARITKKKFQDDYISALKEEIK
ncbi:MAG: type VII toxin-antitoxin system MntA family adenylyltransferase antitoxin [Candidatus Woesearchaeota archaeon]